MAPAISQLIQWQVLVVLFLACHVMSQRLVWAPNGEPPGRLEVLESASEGAVVWCCIEAVTMGVSSSNPITYTVDSTIFKIGGANNNALELRAPLDREETGTVKLRLSANTKTNSGDPVVLDHDIYIAIVDVNDNAPVFTIPGANGAGYKEFSTEIKEDTKVNTTFYANKMWGIDRDASSTFSRIVFSCDADGDQNQGNNSVEAKIACETFSVSTQQLTGNGNFSAQFKLKKKLNYRKIKLYIMTVMLNDFNEDGTVKHQVNALLLIKVIDIQNESPVFYPPIITANLKDGTEKDVTVANVRAQDQDMENPIDKNPVILSILKVEPALKNGFYLKDFNCTKGQLFPESYCSAVTTKETFDREMHPNVGTYTIFVLAKETFKNGTPNGYDATCQIFVNIIDSNDNAPLINPAKKTVSIAEGRTDAFLALEVVDLDLPENGRFNLSLQQPNNKAFKIIPQNPHVGRTSAQITVANQTLIDYEVPAYRKQVIRVIATEYGEKDKVSPLHTMTGTYTINVIDENDNAPTFAQNIYTADVKENSPAGTSVIKMTATDADSATFGPLTYKIEGDSKHRFAINALTGLVTVAAGAENIDYEVQPKFNIFVVATDKGKKEVTVTLEINVVNENDVNPVFEKLIYHTKTIEKTTVMNPQIEVSATDDEIKTNKVFYSIIDGNTKDNAFVVGRNSGVLSLKRPLNYAEAPAGTLGLFSVIIEANDGGTPPGKSNATVRVQVVDVNDFPPVFNQSTYKGSVSEAAAPEFLVLKVAATDQDGGPNGEFNYQLWGSQDRFLMRQDGWITLPPQPSLDHDVQSRYEMVVYAIDKGAPQMTGSCNVIIEIKDVNNKAPTFNKTTYFTTLPSDAQKDFVVQQLQAEDKDTNPKLEYKIPWNSFVVQDVNKRVISGSPLVHQLAVDKTGRVYLMVNLRPENADTFRFSVTVEDKNAVSLNPQTATATVIVNIFRNQGETPVFNSPWTPQNPILTQSIPEEQGNQTSLLKLIARDPKTNQRLEDFVKVPGSDPDGFFSVDLKTGEVRLARSVDYEAINPKVIRCEVVVTSVDRKRNATAKIIVNVQDINDNSPTFAKQAFTFSISEGSKYPSFVGYVRATDKDSGDFGKIAYTLTGERSQDFMIDKDTGDILVAGRLDREIFPRYQLLVTAEDNLISTKDRKSGIATVTINLVDVNDNSPQFEETEYKMYTMESTPVDTSLGKVLAVDKDVGINSQIFYSIVDDNSLGFFKIDRLRGVIKTATSLLGHARGAPYLVIVEALDNGSPSQRSVTTVQITIQDPQAFIGRPTFINPTPGMVVDIFEEQPPHTPVLTCKASDSDGPASAIRFSFVASRNPDHAKFKIDPISGNITTAEVLDREKQSHYDLQIQATDGTGNVSAIMLGVRLIDIDDHAPSFYDCNNDAKNPLTGSIYENETPPNFVLTVLACDLDTSPNNLLFFKITCGNEMDHFTIGLRDGIIHSKSSLDREKINQYNLCVTVYSADPGTTRKKRAVKPIRSSTIGVKIEVLDRDDNGPTYAFVPKKTFTTGLLINAAYNSLVIDAHAKDPDTPKHSVTFYRLLNMQFMSAGQIRSAPGAFQVDMTSGEVRTSIASYSDYTNGRFQLNIEAYDTLGRKDNATVLIYVLTQSQRLKFIFAKTPSDIRTITPTFMSDVSYVVKGRITTDLIRFSVGDAANFDFQKTDVCFHMVKDNDILLYTDAVTLLSATKPELKKIYETYGMTEIGLCNIGVKTYTRYTEVSFWWVIIVLALFLFIFVLICVLVIICLWNRYRRFMLTNTSYIVRMGTGGNLLTNHVLMSTDISSSKIAASEMKRTSKISYDEIDVSLPVPAPMVSSTETTVLTKTDGGYTNYGYDNTETSVMSTFQPGVYESPESMMTTTTERTSDVVGGTVAVTGGVVGGESTTTVTKETTTTLDPSSGSDMRTINAGGTPTVLRKIVTTTTTVTEEVVEDPSPTSGVVITDVTSPAQPINDSYDLYASVR
ncbi:cadherin-23-like isoform X2 [Lineus longissimus]|uniref:cadherin-23-like isoform X2 n=1 Tax=Lineus longissimus TaxID=88925 RepID=UPI00315D7814